MPTPHDELLTLIFTYAEDKEMSFDDKSTALARYLEKIETQQLQILLGEAGFIPEIYAHDSSEEKVYAKAMDILVAVTLSRIGYKCEVSIERSGSADVTAVYEHDSSNHTIVLDAKAFRLSRTALNPKDYKIEALSTWKRGADFACLVGPIAGFPQGNSRLFDEAIKFQVTMLTFSHLQFLLEHGLNEPGSLLPIWKIDKQIYSEIGDSPDATQYWSQVDKAFCVALDVDISKWKLARRKYFHAMIEVADKQIKYYEDEHKRISSLTKDALIEIAIDALKINNRIEVIQNKKRRTLSFLEEVEEAE